MGRDPWRRIAVIALVVVFGLGRQFAGGGLDGILWRIDSSGRTHVGPDAHGGYLESDHVQPEHIDLNGVDDHLGAARRGGEHRRRPHQ
jgi:hypothetical protein